MNWGQMKKDMEGVPDDYQLVVTKCFTLPPEDTGDKECLEMILDSPIIGTAINDEDKEFRFILNDGENLGKVWKFNLKG